jgi:hypothetical protein
MCIYGQHGEVLPFEVGVLDMAFLLKQKLSALGWSEDRVRRTVEEWRWRPVVDVRGSREGAVDVRL